MTTARSRLLFASITWLVFASVDITHGETIDRVADLTGLPPMKRYLAVLDQMAKEGPTNPVEARSRLLCLIALERRTEARDAIASMVNADPFYQSFTSIAACSHDVQGFYVSRCYLRLRSRPTPTPKPPSTERILNQVRNSSACLHC